MDEVVTINEFIPPEGKCVEYIRKIRWHDKITCPTCGSENIAKYGMENGKQRYMCYEHHGTFRDTTGTVFESAKVPLGYWFYYIANYSEDTSAQELTKNLGVSLVTAHRMKKEAKKLFEKGGDGVITTDDIVNEFVAMYLEEED